MRQRVLSISVIAGAIALAGTYLWPDSIVTRNRDIDEGVYLMVARLIHRGYDIHTFFFDQFWLFPKILATAFRVLGDSLFAGRLIVFAFALAGLIGVAGLCYQLGAKWGAASAAILLGAISPLYLRQSRMVMSDVPATACIVLALVFLFAFQKSRRRFCLALTGVFASAAVIFKPFAIGFGITIIIVVIGNRLRHEKGRLRFEWAGLAADISILVACGVIIAAPFIDFVHLANEYRRTVEFHFAERNWLTKRVDDRWRALVGFCRFNLPWIVCGVAGIVALRPLNFAMWALLAGELATAAILLQMPPWLHHYTLIIPPLIVFSILGFSRGIAALKHAIIDLRNRRPPSSAGKLPAILFAFALLITAIDIPWVVRYNLRFRYSQPVHVDRIVGFLQQNFQPNEYLLSDDALVLYLADRLIPPSAINLIFADIFKFDHTSFTRLDESVRNDNVAGIIVSSRFEQNPRLISWIKEKFPISARVGDDRPNEFTATVYKRGDEAR